MEQIVIKFVKTNDDAQLPKANIDTIGTGDSGYDIYAVEDKVIPAKGAANVATGISLAFITPGYWFQISPRSGLGFKFGIEPHMGTIDNGYRNDLAVKLFNLSDKDYTVKKGDRIAQFIVYKLLQPTIEWAEDIQQTQRGENGLGSSGR